MLKPRLVLKGLPSLKRRTKMVCSNPNLPPAFRIFCRILCPFRSTPEGYLRTAFYSGLPSLIAPLIQICHTSKTSPYCDPGHRPSQYLKEIPANDS